MPFEGERLDLIGILSATEETAYLWNIASDRIEWESNAGKVLGVRTLEEIATGARFQFLIASEHLNRRREAMTYSGVEVTNLGVPYRVQDRFMPHGRRSEVSIWLEDHGRCWSGADGKPARARGDIRVINERYWEEQRLLYRSDHDELTGQLNRSRLMEALGAMVSQAERTHQPCAFLIAGRHQCGFRL